jgi:hypothetical protein
VQGGNEVKVLIDGKEVEVKNDVKVIYDDVAIDVNVESGEAEWGEMHVTLTHEGQIVDLIGNFDNGESEVVATHAEEYGEMATHCQPCF